MLLKGLYLKSKTKQKQKNNNKQKKKQILLSEPGLEFSCVCILFSKLAITRFLRFVATAFCKKVGLIISTKSNLGVCVLIIFFNMLKLSFINANISACLPLPPHLPLKPPIPVNDRPIILVPFFCNVFSLKICKKYLLQFYVCRYLISTIKVQSNFTETILAFSLL